MGLGLQTPREWEPVVHPGEGFRRVPVCDRLPRKCHKLGAQTAGLCLSGPEAGSPKSRVSRAMLPWEAPGGQVLPSQPPGSGAVSHITWSLPPASRCLPLCISSLSLL